MTFTTFDSFTKWCKENDALSIEGNEETDHIVLTDISETDSLILVETLLSAYDSGFHFGFYSYKMDGGSLVIYED